MCYTVKGCLTEEMCFILDYWSPGFPRLKEQEAMVDSPDPVEPVTVTLRANVPGTHLLGKARNEPRVAQKERKGVSWGLPYPLLCSVFRDELSPNAQNSGKRSQAGVSTRHQINISKNKTKTKSLQISCDSVNDSQRPQSFAKLSIRARTRERSCSAQLHQGKKGG